MLCYPPCLYSLLLPYFSTPLPYAVIWCSCQRSISLALNKGIRRDVRGFIQLDKLHTLCLLAITKDDQVQALIRLPDTNTSPGSLGFECIVFFLKRRYIGLKPILKVNAEAKLATGSDSKKQTISFAVGANSDTGRIHAGRPHAGRIHAGRSICGPMLSN